MTTKPVPIPLNRGLDLVTPSLMVEPGSLSSCLNYELTDVAGYRRIDGYEAYDGYPNGNIQEFFRVRLTATIGGNQTLIVPGCLISRTAADGSLQDVGVVVGAISSDTYDIVPLGTLNSFISTEYDLTLTDGSSLLVLAGGGVLLLTSSTSTSNLTITTTSGTQFNATLASGFTNGTSFFTDPDAYITAVRTYSSVLRSLVVNAPSGIAGLYWFEDRLIGVVDALTMTKVIPVASTQPTAGSRYLWKGIIYRMIFCDLVSTAGGNNTYNFYFSPIGTSGTNNDNMVEVDSTGATVGTLFATATTTASPTYLNSKVACLGYFNNSAVASQRGFTYINPSTHFTFDTGKYTNGDPPITKEQSATPSDNYWVVGDAGATVFKVRLNYLFNSSSTGTFAAGTATGQGAVYPYAVVSGTRDYLKVGDVIHSAYPTSASTNVANVLTVDYDYLAGTGALKSANTRYVWDTFNFFGQSGTLTAFGTTGASRAFSADRYSYTFIHTQTNILKDNPKYLAFHANKLALGFAHGSVQLSVVGKPFNFSGFNGALEIATGDDITGLLELQNDTLGVFGKRTIRRITGYTDTDTRLTTIAAKSGCFDYTAVVVGSDAVYTGVNGITTLTQTAAYGDFQGTRVSDSVSTWLRPRLVAAGNGPESAGVALAYPIRSKSQYRLVLKTGDVVIVTFTKEGQKIMFANYGLIGESKVPFAISSEIAVTGKERIHTVWDDGLNPSTCYELESGWGFNGKTFTYQFTLSHLFPQNSEQSTGVEEVRLFGQGYGYATLNLKTVGIENDFNQDFPVTNQDISLPQKPTLITSTLKPVTSIVDTANWGIGIKLKVQNTTQENSTLTEPTHICQVLVSYIRTEGVPDA